MGFKDTEIKDSPCCQLPLAHCPLLCIPGLTDSYSKLLPWLSGLQLHTGQWIGVGASDWTIFCI